MELQSAQCHDVCNALQFGSVPLPPQSSRVPAFLITPPLETKAETVHAGKGRRRENSITIPVASELRVRQAVEELGEEDKEQILGMIPLTYFWFLFNISWWDGLAVPAKKLAITCFLNIYYLWGNFLHSFIEFYFIPSTIRMWHPNFD